LNPTPFDGKCGEPKEVVLQELLFITLQGVIGLEISLSTTELWAFMGNCKEINSF
jgi:hypothetical protein